MMKIKKENKRIHLVNLFKWRSVVAFVACLITFIFSLLSIAYGILNDIPENISTEFQWFTVDSNILTSLAAVMILPYTIEGILKKRFTYPKWAQIIHYAGTICMTITFIFVLCFVSWYDQELAFAEENFFLHIICPLAVLVSFFMVEANHKLTRKDSLLALIPFASYAFIYLYNVVFAKRWLDHYKLNTFVPYYISLPLMFILAYLIASLIRYIHNNLLKKRSEKMRLIWNEELDPVSIKIEIYSLGIHAGMHQTKEDISIPFDILEDISKTFNIKIEELTKAYTKGVIDGIKEVAK